MKTLKTPLVRALALAGHVIEQRNTIPILSNVLLSTVNGRLYVEASDLDTEIAVEADNGAAQQSVESEPLNVTVPHDMLLRIAQARRVFSMVHDVEHRALRVGSNSASFGLPELDSVDFPRNKNDWTARARFQLPGDVLLATLNAVANGISFEETRYYLNGVFVHVLPASKGRMGDLLAFTATDGHRLYRALRPLPPGAANLPGQGVIIPRKVIALLIAALEGSDGDDVQVEISAPETLRIRFTLTGLTVHSKTIDGTFPDYTRVIPPSSQGRLTCAADELASAAEAATFVCNERQSSVALRFGNAPHLAAKSTDGGEMQADMPGETAGELPPSIGFNARYLVDALAPFGSETVTLAFGDAASPMLITGKGRDLEVVLMPMRVS